MLGIIDLAGSESANVRPLEFVCVCVRACVRSCVCVSRVRGPSVDNCAEPHRFGRLQECKCKASRVCVCMCAFMCACVSRVRGPSVDSCAGHPRFGRL